MRNPFTTWRAARHMSPEARDAAADAEVLERLKEPGFADEVLITEYLAGDLSSSDRKRAEERMRTDPEFRARAESQRWIWNFIAFPEREPDLADRIAAERSWEQLKRRIELEAQGIHTPTLEEKRAMRRRRRIMIFTAFVAVIGGLLGAWLRL